MSIEQIHDLFLKSTGISTDSRSIWNGCIYIALKGERFDGNEFAKQAIEQGASHAIVDDDAMIGINLIQVQDGLLTLQKLASYHRAFCGWPTVGITGSNGKTTTKELIGAILSSKFNILITEGNLNNHIGVPLTILKGNDSHEIAVIEMGASHQLDIKELCEIADPDLGLITNIGKAHLQGMGGIDGVLKTKGELFDHIIAKNGKVLLNLNQGRLVGKYLGSEHLSFGSSKDSDVLGKTEGKSGHMKVLWRQKSSNSWHSIQTNLVGDYNLDNVLAAIAIGVEFGVNEEQINAAIESYVPTNNRSEYVESGSNKIIWDAYNANPSSMEYALENVARIDAENLTLILGEMKEVGDTSETEHAALVVKALLLNPTNLFLVGDGFNDHSNSRCRHFSKVQELLALLKREPINNSLILIKGSRSNQLEKLKEVL